MKEPMTFDEVIHYIAQGAINIDEGIITIEKGSRVHEAMGRLCEMLSNGEITADDLRRRRDPWSTAPLMPVDVSYEVCGDSQPIRLSKPIRVY